MIVGLGNPGRSYVNNRHNVGFRCVDFFARELGISLSQRRARSRLGVAEMDGTKVVVAKPRTYMNLSGQAVAALVRRYHVAVRDLLVIYDDLDLPLGSIRIRERGSSGGHNGMKSIIAHLGSQDFPRVRVGVAPSGDAGSRGIKTPDYVLGNFTAEERAIIAKVYPRVAAAIRCLLTEGIVAAMNKYN